MKKKFEYGTFKKDRRLLLKTGLITGINLLIPTISRSSTTESQTDWREDIKQIPSLSTIEKPYIVLNDFQPDPDPEVKNYIKQKINNPELIKQIRNKIEFDKQVRYSSETLDVQRIYIPETREPYTESFLKYCNIATNYVFERTNTPNFYNSIIAPTTKNPQIPNDGITAIIVNQLGKKFKSNTKFIGDTGNSIKYTIKGAIVSNHLGAVDVIIETDENENHMISRPNYTIWQTGGINKLINLYIIPIEETLHYNLGKSTDKELKKKLIQDNIFGKNQVQEVANEHMEVEESVVGGLVYLILAELSEKYDLGITPQVLNESSKNKTKLSQYKYREQGICLAKKIGFEHFYYMYTTDIEEFKKNVT